MKSKNKIDKGKERKKDDDNYVGQVATSENFLIVYNHDIIDLNYQDTRWVIDTVVSIDVTSRKDFSISYIGSDLGVMKTGDIMVWLTVGI